MIDLVRAGAGIGAGDGGEEAACLLPGDEAGEAAVAIAEGVDVNEVGVEVGDVEGAGGPGCNVVVGGPVARVGGVGMFDVRQLHLFMQGAGLPAQDAVVFCDVVRAGEVKVERGIEAGLDVVARLLEDAGDAFDEIAVEDLVMEGDDLVELGQEGALVVGPVGDGSGQALAEGGRAGAGTEIFVAALRHGDRKSRKSAAVNALDLWHSMEKRCKEPCQKEKFKNSAVLMTIAETLQQIYFLGACPEKQAQVAAYLEQEPGDEHVGRWHLFARLARPGLIALRPVSRTTGLDLFLLEDEMAGVEDVAEVIGYGLDNWGEPQTAAGGSSGGDGGAGGGSSSGGVSAPVLSAGWGEFERLGREHSDCLFLTFLRLNWDALMDRGMWQEAGMQERCDRGAPSRTQVLRAVAKVLRRAADSPDAGEKDRLRHLHIAGGTGDSDLIITGLVRSRDALDRFLLTLAQLGTDCLAAELGLAAEKVAEIQRWYPICASSTTELGVPWCKYAQVQAATRAAVMRHEKMPQPQAGEGACMAYPLTDEEEKLVDGLDALLQDGLRSAVFLRRTRSFLTDVRVKMMEVCPPGWTLQAVLGEADMLLRRDDDVTAAHEKAAEPGPEAAEEEEAEAAAGAAAEGASPPGRSPDALSNLLLLLGRLDAMSERSDFPRRVAVVITFDRPFFGKGPQRRELLPMTARAEASPCPEQKRIEDCEESRQALGVCRRLLSRLRHNRRREEYRILERMVERAVTLQRQAELPRELRILTRLALRRLARALEQLAGEDQPAARERGAADDQCALDNEDFIHSGMDLDRTLLHHARGSVPLLLATATQARFADHFGSETTLTSALGAPASAVARRLLEELERTLEPLPEVRESMAWLTLKEALEDMKAPILYASHDPDFGLIVPLGMIRVPRWVIWYPTVSSYVLHEVGHEVFYSAQLYSQLDRVVWAGKKLLATQHTDLNALLQLLRGAPEPVLSGPEGGTSPAAVRCVQQLLEERIDMLDHGHTSMVREWYAHLDEVAAQLFCHRYSYWPAEGSEVGCGRHVHDVLEHIAPLAHRMSRPHRLQFISRELAVRIALRLIELAQKGQNPWRMSNDTLNEEVVAQLNFFRRCLGRWLINPPVPFQETDQRDSQLVQDVTDIYNQLLKEFPSSSNPDDPLSIVLGPFQAKYQTPVGRAINWGIFMALVATSEEVMTQEPPSVVMTQHLWRALLKTSREADQAPAEQKAQEDEIVRGLIEGVVPEHISRWPERLPRRLHDELRKQSRSVKLPQRFALTLALADWMVVNDEMGG